MSALENLPAHPALVFYSKHLASCGSIGMWGKRCGTTQVHTPRAVLALRGQPWFRFRNDECARICREAWQLPPLDEGQFFTLANEAERPEVGWSTRAERDLRKCPLAQWEGQAGPAFRSALYQLGDTEFYQWAWKGDDYCWRDFGRLLRLTDAGRALLATRTGSAEQ